MLKIIRIIWSILTKGLWEARIDKQSKAVRFILKYIRIFTLSGKEFYLDKCLIQASALTYFTFFSLVPVVALLFAIAKGFGFDQNLEQEVLTQNPEYTFVLAKVFEYANSMLKAAKGGIIAGGGVLLLLYSVISLLNNIESVFNQIWEVTNTRSWFRKIADYITIMIFAPIFLIFSSSITILLQTKFAAIFVSGIAVFGIKLLSFLILILVFTFLFKALTNTYMSLNSALFGGFFTALLFEILQWGYITFQVGVSKMNAIYGSFAALPLFLIFIQYSWYIVLFGAELTFAHQHVDKYELQTEINNISIRLKRILALLVLNKVINNFSQQGRASSLHEVAQKLDIPFRLAQNIMNELIHINLITEVTGNNNNESTYLPLLPDYKITIPLVLNRLEESGINSIQIDNHDELNITNKLFKDIEEHIDKGFGNKLVKDIV